MPSRSSLLFITPLMLSAGLYLFIAYGFPGRSQFGILLLGVTCLFILYIWALRHASNLGATALIVAPVVLRLLFLLSIPELSDDFYRFIWDGHVMHRNQNPYLVIPADWAGQLSDGATGMLAHMNSPEYHTVYPPVCQFLFWLATAQSPDDVFSSMVWLRVLTVIAETGTMFLMVAILRYYKLPAGHMWFYGLNPLVVLELTGNLHPDAFMIFFSVLFYYLWVSRKTWWSAGALGLAIGAKLLPLLILPFLFKHLGVKRFISYALIVAIVFLGGFIPFLSLEVISGMMSSIHLYFRYFEFNASVYYLIRETLSAFYGYNPIALVGPMMAGICVVLLFIRVVFTMQKSTRLSDDVVWAFFLYLLCALVVHPWYVTILAAFTVISEKKFALVWTYLVFLSYHRYRTPGVDDSLLIIFLEYLLLAVAVWVELYRPHLFRRLFPSAV
ncbi:MAG: hypothetical protein KDD36_03110 [Flavobacteriales bacterium]|nr:hypothetical protein [Flavobacteriales bacterium]